MGNLAGQNRFWSAKCSTWSENGQWPTVVSSIDPRLLAVSSLYKALYQFVDSYRLCKSIYAAFKSLCLKASGIAM